MASCQTKQWVATAPVAKLTVTIKSQTDTSATLSWKLQYIAESPSNAVPRPIVAKVNGKTVYDDSYAIFNKQGTYTIASGEAKIAKTHKTQSISFSVSADWKLTWSGTYAGTLSASDSISVGKKTSYTVKYNANGGSGQPSSQTKWHGETLTLSSTKPTRSGYTFVGWGTSTTDTSSNYNAGGSYTANEGDTLYAIWSKTITLSYSANGGSGQPSSSSVTVYNATTSNTFTISSTKPTRTGYAFLGWSTSSSATSATYSAGSKVTLSSSTTLYAVWKLVTYTITYDANGGTNAPSSQTKTHGVTLTISKVKPTKTGYTFVQWKSVDRTDIYFLPGDTTNYNGNQRLVAEWKLNTYTVTFDANGGSDAPSPQPKTHGTDILLTTEVPSRKYHAFLGWAESQTAVVPTYLAGATYTANADITLYAVWEVTYIVPRITNVSVERCDEDGNPIDDGTHALVTFNWATDDDIVRITVYWKQSTETAYGNSQPVEATGREGKVEVVVGGGNIVEDFAYNFKIEVQDKTDFSSATRTIGATLFPIDMLAGGKGVSIGKPAKEEGFCVEMASRFRESVSIYNTLTGESVKTMTGADLDLAYKNSYYAGNISSNEDLNNYTTSGVYFCNSNDIAPTLANSPTNVAFRLEVKGTAAAGHTTRLWQKLWTNAETESAMRCYKRQLGKNGWSAWKKDFYWSDLKFVTVTKTTNSNGNIALQVDPAKVHILSATFDIASGATTNCSVYVNGGKASIHVANNSAGAIANTSGTLRYVYIEL